MSHTSDSVLEGNRMGTQAQSRFKIESWDEQPYVETQEGGKLTRASVKQAFDGDIEGDGQTEWLMCYRPDQTADFVGLARFVGRIGERSGSLVLESTGTFDGKEAKGPLTIVAGSGTGDLEGIAGEGEMHAPLGGEPSVSISYRFD
jgi:hypothetical protein